MHQSISEDGESNNIFGIMICRFWTPPNFDGLSMFFHIYHDFPDTSFSDTPSFYVFLEALKQIQGDRES